MKVTLHLLLIAICGAGIYYSADVKTKFQDQADKVVAQTKSNEEFDKNIATRKTELGVEVKGLTAADDDIIDKNSKLDGAKTKQRQIAKEIADLDADLDTQTEELASQEKLIKATKTAVAEALEKNPDEITVDTIAGDIDVLKTTKKDLEGKLDELNALIETAEGRISRNKTNIADLENRKSRRDDRIRSNAKEAVISAVDSDWGICTINAGTNMGFTPQTRLIVTRKNAFIGNISPESINASETIAKINFDSLAPGVSLQAGDRVMLEKPLND